MMRWDFCDFEIHDAPRNQCPECDTLRWYQAGSSNLLPCHNCGFGEPEPEPDADQYE
jgi:Zn ribbon nucleic-acid-binding protein